MTDARFEKQGPSTDLFSFTDEDLLIELRRRGRLKRMDYNTVIPEEVVLAGYPREEQIEQTILMIVEQIATAWINGSVPTGSRVSFGNFTDFLHRRGAIQDRQVTAVINYVVDLP